MVCASLDGRVVWGRKDTRICMVKSLCSLPETTTTLLIGYAPIQNKKIKSLQKKKKDAKEKERLCWRIEKMPLCPLIKIPVNMGKLQPSVCFTGLKCWEKHSKKIWS